MTTEAYLERINARYASLPSSTVICLPISLFDQLDAIGMARDFQTRHPRFRADYEVLRFIALRVKARRLYGHAPQIDQQYRFHFSRSDQAILFKMRFG